MTHDEIVRARNLAVLEKRENYGTAQLREMVAPYLREPLTDRFDARISYGIYYNDTFKSHESHSSRCGEGHHVTPEIAMLLEQDMLALRADPALSISMELNLWARGSDILTGLCACTYCRADSPERKNCECSEPMKKVHELAAKYSSIAAAIPGTQDEPSGKFPLNIDFGEPDWSGEPPFPMERLEALSKEYFNLGEKPDAETLRALADKHGFGIKPPDWEPPPMYRLRKASLQVTPGVASSFAKEMLPMFADEELLMHMELHIKAQLKSAEGRRGCHECKLDTTQYDFCRCSEPMERVHALMDRYHILNWLEAEEVELLKADIGHLEDYRPLIAERRRKHEAMCAEWFGWGEERG